MNTPPSVPSAVIRRMLALYDTWEDNGTLYDPRFAGKSHDPTIREETADAYPSVIVPPIFTVEVGPDEVENDPVYPPPKVH